MAAWDVAPAMAAWDVAARGGWSHAKKKPRQVRRGFDRVMWDCHIGQS
jgi:hypothetical protein